MYLQRRVQPIGVSRDRLDGHPDVISHPADEHTFDSLVPSVIMCGLLSVHARWRTWS
jgi:hypothetical protein